MSARDDVDVNLRKLAKMRVASGKVDQVRGTFLARMIDVEEEIDREIVEYFRPDEDTLFIEQILSNVNLYAKQRTFGMLLKRHGLKTKYRDALKELDDLRDERNRLAHRNLRFVDGSYEDPDGNYRLVRHNSAKTGSPDPATAREMQDIRSLIDRARELRIVLIDARNEINDAHAEPSEQFFRDDPSVFIRPRE